MKCWITGLGWVTPAGCGLGREGRIQPLRPGALDIPTRKQVFEHPDMRFGRLDAFSRVGLAALAFCLRDGRRDEWREKRPIGIVALTRYGCLTTDIDYLDSMLPEQGKLASPNLFAYTLPNCFLGEAALRFGLTGNTLVLNQSDNSGLSAIRYALEDLTWSEQQGVLAGICDLESPPVGEGQEVATPGGVFLLLEKEAVAESYGELEIRKQSLIFAGQEIPDLAALVAACLQSL